MITRKEVMGKEKEDEKKYKAIKIPGYLIYRA